MTSTALIYRSQEELTRAAAYHEAGHAVVGYRYGKFLRENGVSIDLDTRGNGLSHTRAEYVFSLSEVEALHPTVQRVNEFRLRTECVEYLAGYASEFRAMKKRWRLVDAPDTYGALELIERVRGCNRELALLELHRSYIPATRRVLRQPKVWAAVEGVAQALLTAPDGTLVNDHFEQLMTEGGLKQLRPGRYR